MTIIRCQVRKKNRLAFAAFERCSVVQQERITIRIARAAIEAFRIGKRFVVIELVSFCEASTIVITRR